ncbi:ATP-binding protein [Flexithrix dorotheae]|uniref:ATP-binding protein n=1 Tax=Flexithrix dorotheae TaxID=70993 RepID=UPI0003A6495B|nr:ATP-binding protein [Flexithrix dorotheae]
MDFFKELFAQNFMPHGHCYYWKPEILWLHVISDGLIFLAYFTLPIALGFFISKRKDLAQFKSIFILFSTFILLCGFTHIIEIYVVWNPMYRFSGIIKAITALVSVVTAVVAWPMIPLALALPSPSMLQKTNKELQKEIAKRKKIAIQLEEYQHELEATIEELKNTQAKLVQSEKMMSLSILTAGIAHEINNPVNFINAGVQGLKKQLKKIFMLIEEYKKINSENIQRKLQEIDQYEKQIQFEDTYQLLSKVLNNIEIGIKRTSNIVKGLNAFAQQDMKTIQNYKIQDGIDNTLGLLSHLIKNRIHIVKEYHTVSDFRVSPGLINQVWMNILLNAIQAIDQDKEGIITIKILQKDDQVHVSIKDDGPGIPKEVKDQIFVPFFTTKEVGKGTGLGLYISQNIIEEIGGTIQVNSILGEGSEFRITIPVGN